MVRVLRVLCVRVKVPRQQESYKPRKKGVCLKRKCKTSSLREPPVNDAQLKIVVLTLGSTKCGHVCGEGGGEDTCDKGRERNGSASVSFSVNLLEPAVETLTVDRQRL